MLTDKLSGSPAMPRGRPTRCPGRHGCTAAAVGRARRQAAARDRVELPMILRNLDASALRRPDSSDGDNVGPQWTTDRARQARPAPTILRVAKELSRMSY